MKRDIQSDTIFMWNEKPEVENIRGPISSINGNERVWCHEQCNSKTFALVKKIKLCVEF
jgi:hypothetical protein